jgi:NTE family protein
MVDQVIKAIVLGGGGAKGAHSVGAIKHLLGDLEISFPIICGVSVGAITAAFIAQYKLGDEKKAAADLCEMWAKISTKDIYVRWKPFGKWHSLWKGGFYNPAPLIKLIRSSISLEKIRESGKQVSVGVVSVSSGKYTIFDQTSDYFIDAVIASSLFPGMFPPIKIGNELWMDGGMKQISPIDIAIKQGATNIYAIVTSPEKRIPKFVEKPSAIASLKRAIDLSTEKIMSNDIEKAHLHNKLAEHGVAGYQFINLNIIRPKYNLIEDFLDFNPTKIKEMMEIGYQDALAQTIK